MRCPGDAGRNHRTSSTASASGAHHQAASPCVSYERSLLPSRQRGGTLRGSPFCIDFLPCLGLDQNPRQRVRSMASSPERPLSPRSCARLLRRVIVVSKDTEVLEDGNAAWAVSKGLSRPFRVKLGVHVCTLPRNDSNLVGQFPVIGWQRLDECSQLRQVSDER